MHRCKWIEPPTRNDRPHSSQQANSRCIVQTKSLHAMATPLERQYLLDYRNRYDREQTTSPLSLRDAWWPA